MWDSVRNVFSSFSTPLEGSVAHMYQDTLGKVTVGIGILIDSPGAAWATRGDGASFFTSKGAGPEASEQQVKAEWQRVKGDPSLAGHHKLAEEVTDLWLRPEGISSLLARRLEQSESTLRQTPEFADLHSWPADAQLALFSMAWAMGSAFAQGERWPDFRASCSQHDWLLAARNSVIGNSWLPKRNAVNRGLMRSAAWVDSVGADPSVLKIFVPGNLPSVRLGGSDAAYVGAGYSVDTPIAWLQGSLEWLGYGSATSPGTFDAATEAAVRKFQTHEASITTSGGGFTVDGKVGPMTWAALGYLVPRA